MTRRADKQTVARDVAAVEAAGGNLTYNEVSKAWRDQIAGRSSRLNEMRASVLVGGHTTYEDEEAIILVFSSAGDCKIDLLVRPRVNTVRTRDC